MDKIFANKRVLTLQDYSSFNQNVSSEMFYSVMRVLYDTLPCTKNFLRKKRQFRRNFEDSSPLAHKQKVKEIASPKMVRGLTLAGK